MKKFVKGPLVLFCLSCLLIASCEKEPSVQGESLAIFNLMASDSGCSVITINGSFFEGKQLTDNESIKIEVTVSQAGKWLFSSDTVNGFSFTGSGAFTDTGKQAITLKAWGTPARVGNFFFSAAKNSLKRFFSISVLKNDIPTEAVSLKSYVKATIGGVPYYVEAPTIGADNIPYAQSAGDTASFGSFVGPGVYPNPPGTGTLSLNKGFMYHYLSSSDADFKKFFQPGAYPFSSNKCSNIVFQGIVLSWNDFNNQFWTTLKEFGDQRGSSFTIVGIEDGYNNKGHYFVKVKSRFNCKLYNRKTGEMAELTDGEAVSFFIK